MPHEMKLDMSQTLSLLSVKESKQSEILIE